MEAIEVIRIYANDNFNMDDISLAVNMPKGEKNKIMDVVGQDDIFRSIVKINSNMPFLFFYLLKVNLSDVKLVCRNLKMLANNGFDLGIKVGTDDVFSVLFTRYDPTNEAQNLKLVDIVSFVQSLLPKLQISYERFLPYPKNMRSLFLKNIIYMKAPAYFVLERLQTKNFLGKGSFGEVTRMVDNSTGEQYAVKVNKVNDSYDFLGLLDLGELNMMKMVNHPNIIKAMFAGVDTELGGVFCGMPLASSDLLGVDVLRVPQQHRFQWLFEIFSAIHFLHSKGFYHCDLKAENILMVDGKMVVSDLGMGNFQRNERVGNCSTIASPQMLWSRRLSTAEKQRFESDPALKKFIKIASQPVSPVLEDIWALGYVTYFLFTKQRLHRDFLFLSSAFAKFDDFLDRITTQCHITEVYRPALRKMFKHLLAFSNEKRKSNLLYFLENPIFDGRATYNVGEIVKPTLSQTIPVGEKHDLIIKEFLKKVDDIHVFSYFLKFHMIDLFYRVYEICAEFGFEKPIIFYAIILTCCSVIDIETYAEHYAARGDVIPEDVAVCQIILVNICSGHFTRPCLADFITKPKKQKKAFAWLQENPRAYYNYSLSELVSKLN